MSTQIILTSNVKGLGGEGDQVAVADGYARNFLFPQNKAVPATAVAIRKIESLKLLRAERERKELEQAQELANKISKLNSTVELQAGENGKVFGSVTSIDIANALTSRGFEIDKKAVLLDEPIKKIGTFEILIRLHPQVNATFKLTTTSPNLPANTESTASDGKPKTGKARPARTKKA
jgi:large subunit ribosomal protein L9